jgi:esterase/lipase superfamily enzyme
MGVTMKLEQTVRSWRGGAAFFAIVLSILAIAGGTGGCSSKGVPLMPTPVIYHNARLNVFDSVPPDKRGNTLDCFYATQRGPSGPADDRKYNNDMTDDLHVGWSTVQFGGDSMTWPQLVEASTSDPRKQSVSTTIKRSVEVATLSPNGKSGGSPINAGERAFADQVNRALAGAVQQDVSIYVHGFRVDFVDGVAVTAQLKHFLGRRQVTVAFAWPCRQRLVQYGGDLDRALDSAPHLADLVEFLAKNTNAKHINILGYSAGATLVATGMTQLRDRHKDQDAATLAKNLRIGNIVLVGADVDLEDFVKDDLVKMTSLAQYVQVTVSHSDKAMDMSGLMHGGSRLGGASKGNLNEAELQHVANNTKLCVINVTDVPGPHSESGGIGGHGYWYANPWISSDILTTFIWQLPPDQRGLTRDSTTSPWTFPKDYPDRIHGILSEKLKVIQQRPTASAR